MTRSFTIFQMLVAGAAALALAACSENASDKAGGDGPGAAEPVNDTMPKAGDEPVSIIRSDVDIAPDPLLLEPLEVRIGFGESGSDLGTAATAKLQTILRSEQMKAGGAITVRGHTDSSGRDDANLRASQARADAVRDWLTENGVAASRITAIAMGEQNPARPNALPDGTPNEKNRAYNRRVDITIALPPELKAAKEEESQSLIERVSADN